MSRVKDGWICCDIFFGRWADYAVHKYGNHSTMTPKRRRQLEKIVEKLKWDTQGVGEKET